MNCDLIDRHNSLINILKQFEGRALLELKNLRLKHKYDDSIDEIYPLSLSQGSGGILMHCKVTVQDEPRTTSGWKTFSTKMQMYDVYAFKTNHKKIEEVCSNFLSVRNIINKSKKQIQDLYLNRIVVDQSNGDVYCIADIDFYNNITIQLRNPDRSILVKSLQEFELRD
jgi:hypothetical protein